MSKVATKGDKIKRAVASGLRDAARKRRADVQAAEDAWTARKRRDRLDVKDWRLKINERLSGLIRRAVSEGSKTLTIRRSTFEKIPNQNLVTAVESFPGLRARCESREVNYGDSAAPCRRRSIPWSWAGRRDEQAMDRRGRRR